MERDEIFGRLLSIANFMGKKVAKKGEPSISGLYMKDYALEPKKFFGIIHERLMNRSNKFGQDEITLMNIIGVIIDEIKESDFTNEPLSEKYLIHYYKQNRLLEKGYVWENERQWAKRTEKKIDR